MASNIDPPLRLVVFWILLFGFCVRAQTLRTPLFDHHNWRQADTAQIARNFWRERFNPFFPQVDQRGAQERGYVETGFELYAFVVASVARVVGFHVEIGRALNCVLFVVSGAILFGFLARRYDIGTAVIGLFTYAFGLPLSLFLDRAVINEPLLVCLSFVCLASAQAFVRSRSWPAAMTLIVASSTLVRSVSFHSWYEYDPDRPLLCRELRPQLQPRELVAFVDYPSPDLLFCLDRHGWLFGEGEWSSDDLLEAWKQGAGVLVVNDSASTGALPDGIRHHATLMARTGHLTAYRLDAP